MLHIHSILVRLFFHSILLIAVQFLGLEVSFSCFEFFLKYVHSLASWSTVRVVSNDSISNHIVLLLVRSIESDEEQVEAREQRVRHVDVVRRTHISDI